MKYFTDDTAQKYTAEVGGKIPVTNVEYDASVAPAQLGYVMDVFSNATGTFGIMKTEPYRLFSLTITKKHKKRDAASELPARNDCKGEYFILY